MIIGIDGSRLSVSQRSGTENYTYHIIQAIANHCCDVQLQVFTRGDIDNHAIGEVMHTSILNKRLWTQIGLMTASWRSDIDVLFIPAHVIPFFKKPTLPVVVTIHDLRTEFLPVHSSFLQKLYLNVIAERIRAKLATKIIAVSEATKKDIVDRLKVHPEKIEVIYEGVDRNFFDSNKLGDLDKMNQVLDKYSLQEKRYLFFLGTLQPRKNLVRLIKAYDEFIKSDDAGLNLVIAGQKGWMYEDILNKPMELGIKDRVQFLGYVDHGDLPYLYGGAVATLFPSLYEGFGLPILESMAMGTPVMTSNIASMPEVGGDIAVYVDPYDINDIKRGIQEVLNVKLDFNKVDKHLGKFSWDNAGKSTCELLKNVASGSI